ncbi:MAG: glycine cleavage system protein GcvH [Candidatus Thermoplasmatota archaeon]|nr:glycine cleavage system protein GcvH [Candidatus Thermoplasmatota archaeon]MCL5731186.1 glycine cleavage system protein GcvH [Candidatus Thermoplasmatota archaeon]
MYKIPEDLLYTKTHEWFKIDGNTVTVGITDYAQHQLTDVVYIEMPKVGDAKKAGDVLLTIESVKSAEEVYSPVTGTVTEINGILEKSPELINSDSYSNWLVRMRVEGKPSGMSAVEYRKIIGE